MSSTNCRNDLPISCHNFSAGVMPLSTSTATSGSNSNAEFMYPKTILLSVPINHLKQRIPNRISLNMERNTRSSSFETKFLLKIPISKKSRSPQIIVSLNHLLLSSFFGLPQNFRSYYDCKISSCTEEFVLINSRLIDTNLLQLQRSLRKSWSVST